jgi:hypothetical protein
MTCFALAAAFCIAFAQTGSQASALSAAAGVSAGTDIAEIEPYGAEIRNRPRQFARPRDGARAIRQRIDLTTPTNELAPAADQTGTIKRR